MKKKITLFVLVLASMAWGQDVFEKYEYDDNVTYFSISPKMFQMLAKLSIETNDPEADQYNSMVQKIKSFKVITTENEGVGEDINGWVTKYIKARKLEELMRVRDKEAHVDFYIKSADDNLVKELLMFVSEINKEQINLGKRSPETVLLYLSGEIDLAQISKLVNEMNLPGGSQLGKLNEQ